jgi:hypothetical protein
MGEEDDDMKATQTAGYKPGEKKTLEELATLDAQDGNYYFDERIFKEMERIFGCWKGCWYLSLGLY